MKRLTLRDYIIGGMVTFKLIYATRDLIYWTIDVIKGEERTSQFVRSSEYSPFNLSKEEAYEKLMKYPRLRDLEE